MAIETAEHVADAPTGRDLQREETRRRVRDAAITILKRDGLALAKIDDIAKLAEVSRGTFYFHFPTKEDVLMDLLEVAEQRISAEVAALPARSSLKKALVTFSTAYCGVWEAERKIFPDVGVVALRRAAARSPGSETARAALIPFFVRAQEREELGAPLPPEVMCDMFLISAFAAALAWCAHPKGPLLVPLRTVTDIFLKGARGKRRA